MRTQETFGALLLGVMVNTFLYGIVFYQYISYFGSRTIKDRLWIRATVLALFLLDTFHTMALIHMAWTYLILSFSNNKKELLRHQWPCASTGVVTAVTALLTQLFLAYRILRLTNRYVYSVLLFLILGSFASGMVYGIKVFSISSVLDMHKLNKHMSIWLSLESTADISIAGALIVSLSHSRTGFKRSNTVINRLLRASVQTGLFPTIFAVLSFTLLLTRPSALLYDTFAFPISRLYTNTLMDTLLCREELRGILDKVDHSLGSLLVNIRTDIQTDPTTGQAIPSNDKPVSHCQSHNLPIYSFTSEKSKYDLEKTESLDDQV